MQQRHSELEVEDLTLGRWIADLRQQHQQDGVGVEAGSATVAAAQAVNEIAPAAVAAAAPPPLVAVPETYDAPLDLGIMAKKARIEPKGGDEEEEEEEED